MVLGIGALLVAAGVAPGVVGVLLFVGVVVVMAVNLTLSLRQAE